MSMLIGPVKVNCVKDAELKIGKSGNAYVKFSVAYNERVKDDAGNWGPLMWEDAKNEYDSVGEYHDVTVFAREDNPGIVDQAAELKKGDFIEITGKRSLRGYLRKDGSRGTASDIVVDAIKVINTRSDSATSTASAPEVVEVSAAPF